MSIELKVKAKSLAAEAKIIRQLELKLRRDSRFLDYTANDMMIALLDENGRIVVPVDPVIKARAKRRREKAALFGRQRSMLHHHRTVGVRRAARSTHLARAYLRGRSYSSVEIGAHVEPDSLEISRLVAKYGGESHHNVTHNAITAWFNS